MDTDQILDSVELMAGVVRDGARLAVDATLLTLAERVGRAAAAGLAGGLPGELEAVTLKDGERLPLGSDDPATLLSAGGCAGGCHVDSSRPRLCGFFAVLSIRPPRTIMR